MCVHIEYISLDRTRGREERSRRRARRNFFTLFVRGVSRFLCFDGVSRAHSLRGGGEDVRLRKMKWESGNEWE